jgi:hypothetical protein
MNIFFGFDDIRRCRVKKRVLRIFAIERNFKSVVNRLRRSKPILVS